MSRRKKHRKHGSNAVSDKKPGVFNPTLQKKISLRKGDPSTSPDTRQELSGETSPTDEEETLFLQAMEGVRPLRTSHKRVAAVPNVEIRPAHPAPDDALEVITQLSELVAGSAELDITFSDEYVEGAIQGFSPKLMQRLKRGEFPIQKYIDLHGLTKQEARTKVSDFIRESHHAGLRCVLLVHGRGLNSENHIPVLKERLPHWLTRGPARKIVLAFSTARPYDGGTGALYVLLRKKKRPR